MPHGERRKYEVWKCKGPSLGTIVLFILFYFYIVVDNIIYNFIMIGGHNKNVCLSWTKVIFKKNLFI